MQPLTFEGKPLGFCTLTIPVAFVADGVVCFLYAVALCCYTPLWLFRALRRKVPAALPSFAPPICLGFTPWNAIMPPASKEGKEHSASIPSIANASLALLPCAFCCCAVVQVNEFHHLC